MLGVLRIERKYVHETRSKLAGSLNSKAMDSSFEPEPEISKTAY